MVIIFMMAMMTTGSNVFHRPCLTRSSFFFVLQMLDVDRDLDSHALQIGLCALSMWPDHGFASSPSPSQHAWGARAHIDSHGVGRITTVTMSFRFFLPLVYSTLFGCFVGYVTDISSQPPIDCVSD